MVECTWKGNIKIEYVNSKELTFCENYECPNNIRLGLSGNYINLCQTNREIEESEYPVIFTNSSNGTDFFFDSRAAIIVPCISLYPRADATPANLL